MSETMIILYLLMNLGYMSTGAQVTAHFDSYAATQTVPNANLVRDDPVFPQSYRTRNPVRYKPVRTAARVR